MLYIEKGSPPGEMLRRISEIKSSPKWKIMESENTKAIREAFDSLPKEAIRESLLKEQHYLCAYCMRRITNDGRRTTIEHWYPLSKDKERALDYKNMLAVCDGGRNYRGTGRKVLCCDACKADDRELKISPFNRQLMDMIAYDKNGYIKMEPRNVNLDKELTYKLGLNGLWKNDKFVADTATGLVKGRRDAYQQYRRFIERLPKKEKWTSARLKKKMDEITKAEQRMEFAGVYLYFLNKKYQSLLRRGL